MGNGAIPLTQRTSHYYDAVSRKFTGKERDSESGLDNFGARYNSSSVGRFMSPDPIQHPRQSNWSMDAFLATPQRWNQYTYALNNPLLYVDRDGAEAGLCYGCGPGGRTLSPLESGFPESQHPIRDTVLMGAGTIMALGAPAAAGAALVRFFPLLTAAGAALQGARDKAAEAMEDIKGLSSSVVTNSRIGSALNALKQHATDMDLKGVIREGIGALKGSHFNELTNTVESLKNLKDSLQGALANPNLGDDVRAAYNQAITAINGFVSQAQPLIDQARRVQQSKP
jgi:RHS repeat-associated protein